MRLALHVDFQGQTGRVRLFNSVEPKTSPPSHGDRDGIVLLRQVRGETTNVERRGEMFLIANIVTTSKAPVTTSVALVSNSKHCYY